MAPPDPSANSGLQHARSGDLQEFEQLVHLYQAEVFGLALRLTGQHSAASELAQDVFVHLHAVIGRIASHAHLRHWLSRSVAQRAVDRPWQPDDEPDSLETAADPGADFTARVMARVELRWSHRRADFAPAGITRKHRWRSGGVVGAVAVISVAAMLALWTSGKLHKPPLATIATPAATAAGNAPQVAATARSDAAIPATSISSHSSTPQDTYPQYTVIVLPLRQASLDAGALAPAEAFHTALITELRKVPGVALLVPGVTAPPETLQSADYLLTVTSLAAQTLPSGGTAFRITDSRGGGSLSAGSPAAGQQWPVEIRIRATSPRSTGFTSILQVGEDSASLPQLAAKQVEMLRARMFPDSLVKQQLMARIRDASLSAMDRNSALEDLLGPLRNRGPGLDSIDVGVIVAGAAAMPAEERARLWRSLRGVSHPDLVEALIDSMRREPDTNVRFEALATLVADYGTEARVRAAMESVSREDPAQVMRMAARRARYGDDEWRRYLVTALKDATLPLPERLAPLLLAGQSATTAAETQSMRAIMNDEEIVHALVGMIRDSWFDYTQTRTIGDALDLLASAGDNAVPDLLVEIPQSGFRSAVMASAPAPQVSPAAMSWLSKNRNNPRVRRILDDIARGKVDPQLDSMIEQMQQRPPPRR